MLLRVNQCSEASLSDSSNKKKPFNDLGYFSHVSTIVAKFPFPHTEILPGIKWGHFDVFYTPAYWKLQYSIAFHSYPCNTHKIGNNIIEEVVACLLGGYGLPAEIGIQAFERLKSLDLIRPGVQEKEIYEVLRKPFALKNNKIITYRFFNQKSNYISSFLNREDLNMGLTSDDICLRSWLLSVKGIGPKTASWITRNWLKSEKVAIIDIHIFRAGVIVGIFKPESNINKEYFELEKKYLKFCNAMGVLPSFMDSLMWNSMKRTNKIALKVINSNNLNGTSSTI